MSDHERIFLEQPGAPDRCWCQDDAFEGGGIAFIRADIVAVQLAEARDKALEEAATAAENWECSLRPGNVQRLFGQQDGAKGAAAAIRELKEENSYGRGRCGQPVDNANSGENI